jgi:dienelactone hydrolase
MKKLFSSLGSLLGAAASVQLSRPGKSNRRRRSRAGRRKHRLFESLEARVVLNGTPLLFADFESGSAFSGLADVAVPSLPAGGNGARVGLGTNHATTTASIIRNFTLSSTPIPLPGQTAELPVSAIVGLAAPEQGDLSFRFRMVFDDGSVKASAWSYFGATSHQVMESLTGSIVPNDTATSITDLKLQIRQAEQNMPAQTIYVDDVLVEIPEPAPLVWYKLDEASGTVATDSAGNGFDGTVSGGTWTAGQRGGAIEFNADGNITVPATALDTVDREITIAMWVYGGDTQPVRDMLLYGVNASGERVFNVHLPWDNGWIYWDAGYDGGYDRISKAGDPLVYQGSWHHWAFTKNADTGSMKIYLDGELWQSGTGKTRSMAGVTSFKLGSATGGPFHYDGLLDDVRIYDRELSPAQVLELLTDDAPVALDILFTPESGDWNTATNWSTNVLPGQNATEGFYDRALIAGGKIAHVTTATPAAAIPYDIKVGTDSSGGGVNISADITDVNLISLATTGSDSDGDVIQTMGSVSAAGLYIGQESGTGDPAYQITGGTLGLSGNLSIANSGTFSLQGDGATVSVGNSMTMTGAATLEFVLGTLGVDVISVANTFSIDSPSQLVVDGTDYEALDGYFPLVEAGNLVGGFEPASVTLIGFGEREPAVVQESDGLWLRVVAPSAYSASLLSLVPDSTVAPAYDATQFSATRELDPSGSAWTPSFNEAHVMDTRLSQQSEDGQNNQSWDLRVGRGGQIYSLRTPELGETVPPQWRSGGGSDQAPWVDEVWQGVAVDTSQNDPASGAPYFIHQSGVYLKDPALQEPFYSPQVAANLDPEERSFTTVNWGQHAHIANFTDATTTNDFQSHLLYYTRYRDLGQGVIEVSLGFYNYGDDILNFLNTPWGGVRRTSTEYAFLSDPGGATWNGPLTENFGNGIASQNDTGGWFGWSDSSIGAAPAIGLVYGKDPSPLLPGQTSNSLVRWGYAGGAAQPGEADWRNYHVLSTITRYNLDQGSGIWRRYYFALGDDLSDLADRIAQRGLADDPTISEFDYTESTSPLIGYSFTGNGEDFRIAENSSTPDFYLYAHPVNSSFPIYEIIESDNLRYLSWDHYATGVVKTYDGTIAGTRLLGFAPRTSDADSTTYEYESLATVMSGAPGNYLAAGENLSVRITDRVAPPPPPPQVLYKLDEASGTVATDASGNGFDGTVSGGTWTTGQRDGAIEFNADGNITVPASALATVDREVTIAMWVYGGDTQPVNDMLLYGVNTFGERVFNVHLPWSDGRIYWDAGYDGGVDRISQTGDPLHYQGSWHHWAFTKNADTGSMKIYLDGALWHSGTGKTRSMAGVTSFTLGSANGGPFHYDGLLDDVRIYDRELSQAQVLELLANDAPVANDDGPFSTDEDTDLNDINVLVNDSDVDGDILSVTSASALNGSVIINADGTLNYTPAANFHGADTISYAISDGNGGSDTAIVTVEVEAVNDSPIGIPAIIGTPQEGQILTVDSSGISDADGLGVFGYQWRRNSTPITGANESSYLLTSDDVGTRISVSVSYTDGHGTSEGPLTSVETDLVDSAPGRRPKLATGVLTDVGTGAWTTVNLPQSYNSMVIVATPVYVLGQVPLVTRISNVTANSFDVKVQRADGMGVDLSGVQVQYVVAEEGVYDQANDGITMEAVKFTSTITDENNSWLGQQRSYLGSYTSPVVLGQVMSTGDANWSTFWSRGSSRTNTPDATNLHVGKHVGEDSNTARADETLGYLVIESGSGKVDGLKFSAGVGGDIVRGVGNGGTYTYNVSGLNSMTSAVASITAMDGGDGGWALLNGPLPPDSTSLSVIIDEDQLGNSERNHTTEQVAYFAFEHQLPPTASDDSASSVVNEPVVIDVLANDSDPNGDSLSVASVTDGATGNVTINGDGTVTYTPATDFVGTDSFTYTVTDGRGGSATANVDVELIGNHVVSDDDLVAHLTLDGDTADTSPYGVDNSGALQGNANFALDAIRGQVLSLDGIDNFIIIANSSDINTSTVTQRTISLAFHAADVNARQVLFEEGGGTRGLVIYIENGKLYVGGWNKTTSESGWAGTWLSTDVASGQWHHVALTLNGSPSVQPGALRGYLDGRLFGAGDGSQLWAHSGGIGVGGNNGSTVYHNGNSSVDYRFEGLLDEVRIYNRTLSDDEVSILGATVSALGNITTVPTMFADDTSSTTTTVNAGELKAIYFNALDYQGSPTRVYAYVGIPAGASAASPVPAVVLVHGGGGTAFSTWVQKWLDRGYAAISIAVEGQTDVPAAGGGWEQHAQPGPSRVGIYGDTEVTLTDQWMYHAVADTVLANNLMRSLDVVNADNVGIMGISWGGVITSTVIGIDDRFKFAIPVYGSGHLYDVGNHYGAALGDNELYRQVWDPMVRMNQATMPTLWLSWPQESNFSLDSQAATYLAASGQRMVTLIPGMGHGHGVAWNRSDSYEFADGVIATGTPWARQERVSLNNGVAEVVFSATKTLDQAELVSTTGTGYTGDLTWVQQPATLVDNQDGTWTITAVLPAGTTGWFLNGLSGDLVISSDYQENIELFFDPSSSLEIDHPIAESQTTESVNLTFTAPTNVEVIGMELGSQSHPGAFTTLAASPLVIQNPTGHQIDITFDNTIAGLALGETATATLTVTWEALDGTTTLVQLPISATARDYAVDAIFKLLGNGLDVDGDTLAIPSVT